MGKGTIMIGGGRRGHIPPNVKEVALIKHFMTGAPNPNKLSLKSGLILCTSELNVLHNS